MGACGQKHQKCSQKYLTLTFFKKLEFQKPYNYDINDYTNSKEKQLELHKAYLKEIENEENNRLNVIENKTPTLNIMYFYFFSHV